MLRIATQRGLRSSLMGGPYLSRVIFQMVPESLAGIIILHDFCKESPGHARRQEANTRTTLRHVQQGKALIVVPNNYTFYSIHMC